MRLAALLAILLLGGCLSPPGQLDPAIWPHERYLLADRVPDLVIEVRYSSAWEPSEMTLAAVEEQVRLATGRDRVEVREAGRIRTTPGADDVWSMEEYAELKEEISPPRGPGGPAIMALAFVGGKFERSGVAGLGGFDSAVVFSEVLYYLLDYEPVPASGLEVQVPNPDFPYYERAAAVHELGHLLGLVNRTVARTHGTTSSDGQHSDDLASVMYPAVHGVALAGLTPEEVPFRFADEDIADLRTFQASRGFTP